MGISKFVILFCLEFAFSKEILKPVPVPTLADGELAVFDGQKYKKFRSYEEDALVLSSDCQSTSGKRKCEAKLAVARATEKTFVPEPNISPAAHLCNVVAGTSLIVLDQKKQELNFCQFSDGSMVGSWSLFYKIFPKNIIK